MVFTNSGEFGAVGSPCERIGASSIGADGSQRAAT
jgi:hypothetical protein